MSSPVFYRSALARPLTPGLQELFQALRAHAEQIDVLTRALPDQLLANRQRREGRPVKFSRSAKKTIRSFEQDSKEAAGIPLGVARLRTEAQLVQCALISERQALRLDQALFNGLHPEDEALARPVLELRAEVIARLEQSLSQSGW